MEHSLTITPDTLYLVGYNSVFDCLCEAKRYHNVARQRHFIPARVQVTFVLPCVRSETDPGRVGETIVLDKSIRPKVYSALVFVI